MRRRETKYIIKPKLPQDCSRCGNVMTCGDPGRCPHGYGNRKPKSKTVTVRGRKYWRAAAELAGADFLRDLKSKPVTVEVTSHGEPVKMPSEELKAVFHDMKIKPGMYAVGSVMRLDEYNMKPNCRLYRMIYLSDLGYVVYRACFDERKCSTEDGARAHRQATFVDGIAGRDYCRYRNGMVDQFGSDALVWED